MKKYILLFTFYLIQSKLYAQDPYFSQFNVSTMTYNPALLGSELNKEYKVSFIVRNKYWGENASPYTTNALTIEKQITKNSDNFNLLYVGLQMLNERSAGGVLTNSYFGATINDKIKLSENDNLCTALSFSYANRLIDLNKAVFQSQFGSFGFIPTSTNYDPVSVPSIKYLDMNAGLSLSHKSSDQFAYQLGIGLFHINNPNQSVFNDQSYHLDMRSVLQGSVFYSFNEVSSFMIGSNLQVQGTDKVITFGGNYNRYIEEAHQLAVAVGVWNRVNEAIYPYLGIQYNDLKFAFSYDIPTGDVKSRFNSVTAIEASLTWDIGKRLKEK